MCECRLHELLLISVESRRMPYLTSLRARLSENDRDGDGYFIRLNDGSRVGPMTGVRGEEQGCGSVGKGFSQE